MAQKILNGVHISGTTQLDFMPGHESEGIIKLGRYDSNTSRYHNIKSYVSSTGASNYLKFSLHAGTSNAVVDVLTLNGNKAATFTGDITINRGTSGNPTLNFIENSGGTQNASITFDQGNQNTLTIATGYVSPNDTNKIVITPGTTTAMTLRGGNDSTNTAGAIQFNGYIGTRQTGTPTYLLGTDASGNVVKTLSTPGGGPGPYLPLSAGSTKKLTGVLYIQGTNTTDAESVLLRGVSSNDGDFLGSIRTANTGGYNQEMRFYTSNANGTTDEDLTLTLKPDQSATFAGAVVLLDGKKLEFGGGGDFKIWHAAGENTYLRETGEGATVFQSNGWYFQNTASPAVTGMHLTDAGAATFAGNINLGRNLVFDDAAGGINQIVSASELNISVANSAHDSVGWANVISAGAPTAGTTNNIAGGHLYLAGGAGKGTGAGGDIIFRVAPVGSSGSAVNAYATALTISDDKSATFAGFGTFETALNVIATDGGGAPAMTAIMNMHGYDQRGVGIKMKDNKTTSSNSTDAEWFVGTGYNSTGFNIGYASDGSQSSYPAQSKLAITTGGNATFAGTISSTGSVYPTTNGGGSLGLGSKQWAGVHLTSSSAITWANGDASILEGEVGGYSLSFNVYNGSSAMERVLLLEKSKAATFAGTVTTTKLHDYDTIPANQNLLDISSIKIAGINDIYGNATKTVITDYVAKYVNSHATNATTIRIYVDDNILVDGDTYMVSVYYENLIGTLGIDFADETVTGNGSQTGTSSVPTSGRIYGYGSKADYTGTFRFVDINLSGGAGREVTLHSPKVEAGKTLTDFVATERTDMPTNSMHIKELIATSDATFAGNVTIGSLSGGGTSVGKGLNIGNASPTIQLFDTTNNATLLMYTQDSNSVIGTYSNHALTFFTDSTQVLNLDTSQNATFAGEITSGDDINSPTKIVIGESATAELRLKKTNTGVGSVKFYNNDGSNSTSQAYLQLDASEDLVLYAAANNDVLFYAGGDLNETKTGANSTFAGNVTVSGNLTISGTTTTLNTQTVEVKDNILQLNTTQGSPNTATAATSGISVFRGLDSNGNDTITQASLIFDEGDDTWDLTNNLKIAGSLNVGPGPSRFTNVQNAGSRLELYNLRNDLGNVEVYRIAAYNGPEVTGVHFYRGGGGNSGYTKIFAKKNNASSLEEVVQFGTNDALTTTFAGGTTVAGNIDAGKNVFQDISSRGGFIMRPWGADYLNTQTNVHTGAIKIKLPTGASTEDDMIKFTIDIYQYSTNESLSVDVGGYIYRQAGINDSWRNVTAIVNAKSTTENYTVRFGDDGTNHCVWIGELNTVWNHPNIICRNFYGGFSVETEDYLNEWDISFEATSFSHVSQTQSNNFPLSNGVFAGNVQHTGLTMTTGTNVDQIYEAAMTFQLVADAWTDTGINATDLATGTYVVQVNVQDYGVNGGHYNEFYSGVMSWYSGDTNDTNKDEIVLHRAGHAPQTGDIQLRTERTATADTNDLMLQVKHNLSYNAALDNTNTKFMRFKFRRLI